MLFATIKKLRVVKETKQWVQFALLSSYKISHYVKSINMIRSLSKVPDFLSDFNHVWNFSTHFHENLKYQF